MKTIKLELSVKILLAAIAVGLFLNAFDKIMPNAKASYNSESKVRDMLDGVEWFHLAGHPVFAQAVESKALDAISRDCYIWKQLTSSILDEYEFRCSGRN